METEKEEIPEKISQYMRHLYDKVDTADIHEFLMHSIFYIDKEYSRTTYGGTNFHAVTDPEIFKKYQGEIFSFKEKLISKFYEIWQLDVTNLRITPDLSKFHILENRIVPINTPWEQINQDQKRVLEQLRTSVSALDFQNVGNSCRSILEKLSNEVFDPRVHKADNPSIELSPGKYKNRLNTYVRCKLSSKHKELRELAISMVNAADDSVDVSNKVTHDLNASQISAEFSVISTVTVVSLIKRIHQS